MIDTVWKQRTQPIRILLLQGLFYAAFGAAGPFVTIYYKRVLVAPDGSPALGLIGLVLFAGTIVGVLSLPVAGLLADRFKIENRLLALLSVLAAAGMGLIATVGLPALSGLAPGPRITLIITGVVVNGLFVRPMIPLIDTETLIYLRGSTGGTDGYGRFRVAGTVGWVVTACLTAWLLGDSGSLSWALIGCAGGYLLLATVAGTGFRAKIQPVRIPWRHLAGDRVFLRYLAFSFIMYLATTSSYTFTSYLFDDLGMGTVGIGMALGLGAAPEIPIMLAAGPLLRRFGDRTLIQTGAAVVVLKLVLFAVARTAPSLWYMAAVHSLTGVGFPLILLGAISLVDGRAHPDLRATYQTLNHVVITVAMALGGPFATMVVGRWGAVRLMAVDAGLITVAMLYLAFLVPSTRRAAAPAGA